MIQPAWLKSFLNGISIQPTGTKTSMWATPSFFREVLDHIRSRISIFCYAL